MSTAQIATTSQTDISPTAVFDATFKSPAPMRRGSSLMDVVANPESVEDEEFISTETRNLVSRVDEAYSKVRRRSYSLLMIWTAQR